MAKLTNKKKQERIQEFIKIIESFGFKVDRWGNFKLNKNGKEYRFKIMKINIRFEIKIDSWWKIFSKRIINTTPECLKNYFIKRGFHEFENC